MDILISIAAKVAEYTVEPIGRQLGYLFCYKQNIEDLNTKIVDLGRVKERLQHKVDEAKSNGRGIEADVNDWFTKVEKIISEDHEDFTRHEVQANTKFTCGAKFPNLVLRHRLSRKAKKMAAKVTTQVQDGNNFKQISYRRNPQSSIGNKGYEDFKSRTQTLTNVMAALRDPSVDKVGVWGMGGVGKTMLAKEVARRAEVEEKLFTKAVFTAISKDPNIEKIQQEIGEKLGMQLHEVNKDVRAERLRNRLREENNLLIIIDDIWDKLDLEDVGISFGIDQKGCKILLTTRSSHVLANDMGVDRNAIFAVGSLLEDEAMSLFRKIVDGQAERHDDFEDLATQIVKECGGLPIAITTIASALKHKDCAVWKNALQELRNSYPINIPRMEKEVYTCIKLSYYALESKQAKLLLLLCSLFPEDAEIQIRELCHYGFGFDLFEDVNTLEEARNRTDTLVTILKGHSLLLDADSYRGYDRVKLHDVIRDVVIFIASNLRDHGHPMRNIRNAHELDNYFTREMFKDCTAISLCGIEADQYPQTLKGPELKLLRLVSSSVDQKLPHHFFEGLNKLLVLDLVSVSLEPLPRVASSFCLLPNLQTLHLTECTLGDISWIGELKDLKILDLSFNLSITELPRGIGKLSRLLSLNLEGCRNLKVIEPNVISSLTRLEELNLKGSFTNWEVEGAVNGDERRNANLSEVKKLCHLVDLKLDVPDINSLPKDIFSEKLEKYCIRIGEIQTVYYRSSFDKINNTSRTLKLKLSPNSVSNEHEFEALLGRCTALDLNGLKSAKSVAFEIDRTGFQHLKHLEIRESNEIRCIVDSNNGNMDNQPAAFPILESLVLLKLINLENIIHEKLTTETSFGKLREIDVSYCDKLKSLFPLFNIPKQLESIRVWDCNMMEEIISHDGREGDHVQKIELSQLRSLSLGVLPKLVQFIATSKSDEISEGQSNDDSIAPLLNGQVLFPKLEVLYISSLNIQKIWIDHQLQSSGFQSLTKISVSSCHHLEGLIPSCMIASFVHLRSLRVESCTAMKEIVFIEESAQVMGNYISLPKLDSLQLFDLPKLERFCGGDISFPQLHSLELEDLPNLERFCGGDISFPQLQSLRLQKLPNLERFCGGDISFPQLESLLLQKLPKLERFCGGDISLPKLDSLELEYLPNLERFCGWDCVDCPSLSKLEIRDCLKLRVFITNTMPTTTTEKEDENSTGSVADKQHLSGSHHKLERIRVENCKMMEEIISHDGREGDHVQKIEISQLRILRLVGLPNLVQFKATGKSDEISEGQSIDDSIAPLFNGQVLFPKLEELGIHSLNFQKIWIDDQLSSSRFGFQSLTRIFVGGCHHLEGLIPSSMTASLVHLRSLNVRNCKAMKEIVFIEESAQVMGNYISLPKLDSLQLFDLPKLERFCGGDISFPQLQYSLELEDLPNLERFCGGDISFPQLESLKVDGLPNLERFCGGDFSSPQLESLLLDGLPNLERFCGGDYVDCPSLSKLNIRGCQKLRVFITNTMPTTTTEKEDENSMGSVADKQHLSGSHHKDVVKVELSTCSEITCQPHPLGSVEQDDDIMVFKTKRLSQLRLWDFPNQQQLPKTFQTVDLLSICGWGIRLKDLATPLTCFQNLKVLKVKDCHGLTSLLSPSTAKSLSQQLTQLAISGCRSLRQVIANDDKEAADNINIIFSKLERLVLDDLSSLTSFYSGNNNVVLQFPHLDGLIVGDCPEMKIFYHGNIHCPSLHRITLRPYQIMEFMWDGYYSTMTRYNYWYWKGDINTTIQKLWEDKNIGDSPESEENVENAEEDHVPKKKQKRE